MPESSHRRRQIPWLDVVRHHKEITRRAEETFFSLPVAQTDSDRWSSIVDATPDDFAGPWKLASKNITSAGMLRNIRGEKTTEFFIGCACWHAFKKVNNTWVVDWRPSIYRQVEILEDEEEIILKPAQGRWEFSPLVFSLLDTKWACQQRDLDEWLPQLLESAFKNHLSSRLELSSALIELFSRDLPALGEELKKHFPQDKSNIKPSQWILFAAPATTTGVNQHLMADYKRIENRLEIDLTDIGGLRLFEDLPSGSYQNIELLPIVALNESQRTAVCNILLGKPVTVISGPPGCGKSQVVVSTLLNAWAKGTSVIFASNNNKAVDVVLERINKFEKDFHIAVRAGSSRESKLEDALRLALNVVTDSGKKKGCEESANKQIKRSEERNKLQQFIDSKVPQKIDESLKSALEAYANYLKASQCLVEKDAAVRKLLLDMHYKINAESFETELLTPLQNWLEEIQDVRIAITTKEQESARLAAELTHTKTLRDVACQKVGLETQQITNWEWLVSGPDPEILRDWRDRLRDTLNKPLEICLVDGVWVDAYDQWTGSTHVQKWHCDATMYLNDVRVATNRLAPLIAKVNVTQTIYKARQQSHLNDGLPENVLLDRTILVSWMALFAEHTTTIKSRLDWLPWTIYRKRERQLQQLEKQLRPALPVSIWQRIGVLNNEGRSSLGLILEKCQTWIEVQQQWFDLVGATQDIENTYFQLRTRASNLSITNAPASSVTSEWQNFESDVVKLISVAECAERSWRKKEEKNDTVALLRSLVTDFDTHGSGIPLKEEWRKGRGNLFDSALKTLADNPCAETLVAARTALYTSPLDDFLVYWDEARQNEARFRRFTLEQSRLPTNESLIETWWRKHPKQLPTVLVKYQRIPEQEDPIFKHLTSCIDWQRIWEDFLTQEKPQLQKTINEEYSWARDGLSKVSELLSLEYSEIARKLVHNLLTETQSNWPTEELLNAFFEFGPEAIKSRIERIDQELEDLSFTFARDEWIGKLSADIELQDTLRKLLNNFGRKKSRIEEGDYELFRKALKAVPIWITTAQATQSIPLLPNLFDLLIIDEATQCTVTNLLPLVYRAKHIAVIGDKEQLNAITSVSPAAEAVLASSFGVEHLLDLIGHTNNNVYEAFVQCMPKRNSDIITLDEHYRSHPLIIGFANEHIYKKRLRLNKDSGQGAGSGLFCRNVVGSCERVNQSWHNQEEAKAVVETVQQLRVESQHAHFTLGVVTPFKEQVKLISKQLDGEGLSNNVLVGTAHSFQGDERDIIIFSPVVSRGITEAAASWVEKPPNLINVAVTRAREALFLVGDLSVCRQQPGILGKLAAYAERVELLRKTSREELELFSWMVIQGWTPEVHPVIGDIEVDFTLRHEGRRLAIEVDGPPHNLHRVEDSARDAFLMSKGYMVIRIPTRAVRETPAVCIEKIEAVLQI